MTASPRSIKAIVSDIDDFTPNGDYLERLESLTEELAENPEAQVAIEPLLRLLERFPEEEFGSPGSIVHFVERFYKNGYEDHLLRSLNRRPTAHTIWMLNRLLNASSGSQHDLFFSVMKQISAREIPEATVASEFIAHHNS